MFFWFKNIHSISLPSSQLYSEQTFYRQFISDLKSAKKRVIIESPYITVSRMEKIKTILLNLLNRNIKLTIVTRDPSEHDDIIRYQATEEILSCKEMGVNIVLEKGNHHRKLAIIDNNILWEGSLNVLSQNNSKEIMRRIEGNSSVDQMLHFLNYS
jgi:phosphatidylserine/phosphatidylglycerophosphate/cardiolipin synthase-like enzyme